jgi:hypothetical protein
MAKPAFSRPSPRIEKSKRPIFLKASSPYHGGMNRIVVLGLFALASMAGCAKPALPGAGSACAPPGGTQDVLIYPAPGSTGIPDNLGEVIFATSSVDGLYLYNTHLIDETGGGKLQVDFGPFEVWGLPIPQPAVTPPFSNANVLASVNSGPGGIGTGTGPPIVFSQGHTITVQLADGACNPVTFGSFTVQ